MANSTIQLGRMDFDEIRSSIKEFMESQGNEIGFNFNGSIAATVLDLLSYNTMYYAFYSNMLINESFIDSAQRIESLISLVKPFGFTISHRQSAAVDAAIKNTDQASITFTPYVDTITGNLNGLQYTFYYTGDIINILENDEKTLIFYQGKSVAVKQPVAVNYETQTFELNDKSIDVRTLKVYVQEGINQKEYTRVKNTDSSLSSISRVYFLETTNTGYKILFGGSTDTDGSQIGRGVGSTEPVFVCYVSGSGSEGNNATNFTTGKLGAEVTNNPTASGGFNSPNLNSIKFLGPRQFSSQGNLVSVSDYEKQIKETLTGFQVNENNPRKNISVYGGTDAADGTAGFVYFSLYGEDWPITQGDDTDSNTQVVNNLTNKLPVGLSLEYKRPTNATITFNLDTIEGTVAFNDLYFRGGPPPGTRGFNQIVKSTAPPLGVGSWSSVAVQVTPFGSLSDFGNQYKFDLKNKLSTENFATSGGTFAVRGTDDEDADFVATLQSGTNIAYGDAGTVIGTVNGSEIDFTLGNDTNAFNSIIGISGNYDITDSTVASNIVIEHELLGELAS